MEGLFMKKDTTNMRLRSIFTHSAGLLRPKLDSCATTDPLAPIHRTTHIHIMYTQLRVSETERVPCERIGRGGRGVVHNHQHMAAVIIDTLRCSISS